MIIKTKDGLFVDANILDQCGSNASFDLGEGWCVQRDGSIVYWFLYYKGKYASLYGTNKLGQVSKYNTFAEALKGRKEHLDSWNGLVDGEAMVSFAKELARELHIGSFRKNLSKEYSQLLPYSVHTDYVGDKVGELVVKFGKANVQIAMAAGYLHDSIEDVLGSEEALMAKNYPNYEKWGKVVRLVGLVSRGKDERIQEYLNRVQKDHLSIAIKLVDLEHNMSDLEPGSRMDKYELCHERLRKDV